MTANLAGCSGGGGGTNGNIFTPTATPSSQNLTFRLQLQNGSAAPGGSVTLQVANRALSRQSSAEPTPAPTSFSGTANSQGIVTIPNVPLGSYQVTFTVNDASGNVLSTTSTSVVVTGVGSQSFLLLQDIGNNPGTGSGTFLVSGRIFLNPDDGNLASANCTTSSAPVTGALLISAIDLDPTKGSPVIAQVQRSLQPGGNGAYTIALPYKPASFRLQIGQFDVSGSRFAGLSPIANFPGVNSVTGLNVCVNDNGIIPGPAATPVPTVSPTTIPGTATPIGTNGPTPTPTTGFPGAPTPTTGFPGAPTPTTGFPGAPTPTTGFPGAPTPTTGFPGAPTPTTGAGAPTPTSNAPTPTPTPGGVAPF